MTIKLHQMLGLAEAPSNGFAWHDRILEGLPARSMRILASCLGVTQRQLAELVMPGVPFHYKMTLSREVANYLYRVALALRQVMPSVQNDMKRAALWLRNPNTELRGRIPIMLLATHTGAEFVFTAISRMKPEPAGVSSYAKKATVDDAHQADENGDGGESEEHEVAELQ